VVQILGGMGNPVAESHAAQLTRQLAALVRGEATMLPAPGIVGTHEIRNGLLHDPFVNEAIAFFNKITLALMGIGAVEPSQLLASSGNVFSAAELDQLRTQGAVGDLSLRFFDADGRPVTTSLDDRVIGISLDQLQRVSRTVGIAGGLRKLAGIQGAIHGGWINVLITDQEVAEQLLDN
jgi:DNA-binding transcriptional regulator LsrR (DeoR family)